MLELRPVLARARENGRAKSASKNVHFGHFLRVAAAGGVGEYVAMSARNGPITVLHTIPSYVRARTKQLGIDRAAYLAILLGNYISEGTACLPNVEGRDKKRKRVTMQITLPGGLRAAGNKIAARYNLSFSRLIESLIVRDAWSHEDGLHIVPKSETKPAITGVK